MHTYCLMYPFIHMLTPSHMLPPHRGTILTHAPPLPHPPDTGTPPYTRTYLTCNSSSHALPSHTHPSSHTHTSSHAPLSHTRTPLFTRVLSQTRAPLTHTPSSHTHPSPATHSRLTQAPPPHRHLSLHTHPSHQPHRTPRAEEECTGSGSGRGGGVQPLPRSRRSKNSAASSRRCTLIIRTCSMGTAGGNPGLRTPFPNQQEAPRGHGRHVLPSQVLRGALFLRHFLRESPVAPPIHALLVDDASQHLVVLANWGRDVPSRKIAMRASARQRPPSPLTPSPQRKC